MIYIYLSDILRILHNYQTTCNLEKVVLNLITFGTTTLRETDWIILTNF